MLTMLPRKSKTLLEKRKDKFALDFFNSSNSFISFLWYFICIVSSYLHVSSTQSRLFSGTFYPLNVFMGNNHIKVVFFFPFLNDC
jgi:hypothetical protein